MKLIYIAGPYRAATRWEEEQNVRRAEELAYKISKLGAYPVIPHSNTRPYFGDAQPETFWLNGTLELCRRCDGVATVEGWEMSKGATAEVSTIEDMDKPIMHTLDDVRLFIESAEVPS